MKPILRDLLSAVGSLRSMAGPGDLLGRPAAAVAYDSRKVVPGAIFVALRGRKADGTQFVGQALGRGALTIVSEAAPSAAFDSRAAIWAQVSDARRALARLAAAFYDHPSQELALIGITGTNGKTTTAYLLASMLESAGTGTGIIGTVNYRLGGETREADRTTPEAPDLESMLRRMLQHGLGACVMEVSSHALALRRVDELHFRGAVFTNLTRDHLDYHGSFEEYFRAKRRLFALLPEQGFSAVNVDDPRGLELAQTAPHVRTYAIDRPADVTAGRVTLSLRGLQFDVRSPRGLIEIRSTLVGRPNVYNILAAVTAGLSLGIGPDRIAAGIERLPGVPGRFEIVSAPHDDVTVVVDYAHTDDALRNLLETARPLAPRRIITVFGCGGERDRTKRPLMGAVAARLSDVVIITSDNPRGEDPQAIVEEVERGVKAPPDAPRSNGARKPLYYPIVDRRAAIERAVELAESGDLILLAGKGHETTQVLADRTIPCDEPGIARAALARRKARA